MRRENSMKMVICISCVTVIGLIGCSRSKSNIDSAVPALTTNSAATRQIKQQCQIKDTADVVTFFTDGTVELTCDGKSVGGGDSRPGAPDLTVLTFPGPGTVWAFRRRDTNVPTGLSREYGKLVYQTLK